MGFLSGITSFVKEHSDVIHGVMWQGLYQV